MSAPLFVRPSGIRSSRAQRSDVLVIIGIELNGTSFLSLVRLHYSPGGRVQAVSAVQNISFDLSVDLWSTLLLPYLGSRFWSFPSSPTQSQALCCRLCLYMKVRIQGSHC